VWKKKKRGLRAGSSLSRAGEREKERPFQGRPKKRRHISPLIAGEACASGSSSSKKKKKEGKTHTPTSIGGGGRKEERGAEDNVLLRGTLPERREKPLALYPSRGKRNTPQLFVKEKKKRTKGGSWGEKGKKDSTPHQSALREVAAATPPGGGRERKKINLEEHHPTSPSVRRASHFQKSSPEKKREGKKGRIPGTFPLRPRLKQKEGYQAARSEKLNPRLLKGKEEPRGTGYQRAH